VAKVEDAVDARLGQVLDGLLRVGVVSGTATGGRVVVTVHGASMTLPRLTSYTPVTNDKVLILCVRPGAWFVLGTPAIA
jgi:hypothetical protein